MAQSVLTIRYGALDKLCQQIPPGDPFGALASKVAPYLIDVWLDDYALSAPSSDVIQTTTAGFSYLFDITPGRLLAAWGLSRGKHTAPRDAARMAGAPKGGDEHTHRGHAIPHTLGGPTDINLVPQLGSVNVGPFRALEKEAVATPGALYFTYWRYPKGDTQRATNVDQGLVVLGMTPRVINHPNL
jgi:hypothetical protein